MKVFPEISETLSQSSLWRAVMRPPFLQSRAWHTENAVPQPSQWENNSGGSIPYWKKRELLPSCSPNSVPLTVEGSTNSRSLIYWISPIHWASRLDEAAWASPREVSASSACCFSISYFPSPIRRAWLLNLNLAILRSTPTRCPVMMKDTVQFAPAVFVCFLKYNSFQVPPGFWWKDFTVIFLHNEFPIGVRQIRPQLILHAILDV